MIAAAMIGQIQYYGTKLKTALPLVKLFKIIQMLLNRNKK